MINRKSYVNNNFINDKILKGIEVEYNSCVIVPIVIHGWESVGTVILLGQTEMSNIELKMAETVASFLSKQLES